MFRIIKATFLLVLTILIVNQTQAQSYNWTLFPFDLMQTTSPHNFSPISPQSSGSDNVNSMFDKGTGQLIFSVNENGIYRANGSRAMSFFGCGASVMGEIEIVPIPSVCNSYYVVYWQFYYPSPTRPTCSTTPSINLLTWKVDWNGSSITVSSSSPSVIYASPAPSPFTATGYATIVADAIDVHTGDRDIYTMIGGNLGKITLHSDGTFGTMSFIATGFDIPTSELLELAIVNGHKTIAFAYNSFFETIDLTTLTASAIEIDADDIITGFEYVPELGYWYVAHFDRFITPTVGGISVYNVNTSTLTAIPNTIDFCNSDLELAKDGELFTVGYINGAGWVMGKLAFLTPSSTLVAPTWATGPPPTSANIWVRNTHDNNNPHWNIQNEIDIEDYSTFYNAPGQGDHGFEIDYGSRVDNANIVSTCIPQEVCPNDLILYFTPSSYATPLSYNQSYEVSWEEVDACGNSIPGSSLNYMDLTWKFGPLSSIDLKTYGNGVLGTSASSNKYFVIRVAIYDACGSVVWNHDAYVHLSTTCRPLGLSNASTAASQINIVPNPATNSAIVQMVLASTCQVKVRVIDAMGRQAMPSYVKVLEKGAQSILLNTSQLSSGIYEVVIDMGKANFNKTLSIAK